MKYRIEKDIGSKGRGGGNNRCLKLLVDVNERVNRIKVK